MSAFTTVTITNYAVANVVFSPAKIDSKGLAKWMAPATVVFDDKPALTLLVREPQNGSSVARVSGKITVPVMDTVDTTKKIGDTIASFEFTLPKQSTLTQRRDAKALLVSLLANAAITDAVENLASVY
jgi:hypothetical protein